MVTIKASIHVRKMSEEVEVEVVTEKQNEESIKNIENILHML